MSRTEPNSLPSLFDDWQDWRRTYAAYAEQFKTSAKDNYFNEALLKVQLKRLGFTGVDLIREIEFIKGGM